MINESRQLRKVTSPIIDIVCCAEILQWSTIKLKEKKDVKTSYEVEVLPKEENIVPNSRMNDVELKLFISIRHLLKFFLQVQSRLPRQDTWIQSMSSDFFFLSFF